MFETRQRQPLPSTKPCDYSASEVQEIARLSPAQGMAAAFGIPRRYLPLADKIDREAFASHKFKSMDFTVAHGELVQLPATLQQEKLSELIDGWPSEHPLIIINSFPHVFLGNQEASTSTENFLFHLLGALANRATQMKTLSGVDVSFLWLTQLEYQRMYLVKPNQALVWGVLTEEPSSYDLSKTNQFLLAFSSYTRILLTSAHNLAALLDKLRISPSYVDYIFNLHVEMPAKREIPAAFRRKKNKVSKRIISI